MKLVVGTLDQSISMVLLFLQLAARYEIDSLVIVIMFALMNTLAYPFPFRFDAQQVLLRR